MSVVTQPQGLQVKRFDLTFKGDILPDHEPEQVREGFADLFRIRDPIVLEELFSGDAFVLRSNLARKAAADYFRRLGFRPVARATVPPAVSSTRQFASLCPDSAECLCLSLPRS